MNKITYTMFLVLIELISVFTKKEVEQEQIKKIITVTLVLK